MYDSALSRAQASSLRRAKANCKKYIDAGRWGFFISLTFFDRETRENYWIIFNHMKRLSRWFRLHGIQYLYTIGTANHGATYHVHLLVSEFPTDLLKPVAPEIMEESDLADVKDSKVPCFTAYPFFNDYGVGMHLIQQIAPDCRDYDPLANYIVGHFRAMKEVMGPYKGRLYFHSRGTGGKSYKCMEMGSGLKLHLYQNGTNLSALVFSNYVASSFGHLLDSMTYTNYIGRHGDLMYRVVGEWKELFSIVKSSCKIWLNAIGWT